mmetsp:Transcript_49162/g.130145  ORF Transcript_49162/g.130145 Transcript_49162/m.130145 type:complete len:374 (-) Transcript_49162:2934-4055(-)
MPACWQVRAEQRNIQASDVWLHQNQLLKLIVINNTIFLARWISATNIQDVDHFDQDLVAQGLVSQTLAHSSQVLKGDRLSFRCGWVQELLEHRGNPRLHEILKLFELHRATPVAVEELDELDVELLRGNPGYAEGLERHEDFSSVHGAVTICVEQTEQATESLLLLLAIPRWRSLLRQLSLPVLESFWKTFRGENHAEGFRRKESPQQLALLSRRVGELRPTRLETVGKAHHSSKDVHVAQRVEISRPQSCIFLQPSLALQQVVCFVPKTSCGREQSIVQLPESLPSLRPSYQLSLPLCGRGRGFVGSAAWIEQRALLGKPMLDKASHALESGHVRLQIRQRHISVHDNAHGTQLEVKTLDEIRFTHHGRSPA